MAPMRYSRWAGSAVSFGPVGRIVTTVLLCLPVPVFVFGMGADPYGLVGLGIWVLVVMPWALRDVWRRVPTGRLDPLGVGDRPLVSGPVTVDPETSITHRKPPDRW